MRISLVGLPGVGKSTIGRKLAGRLEVDFVDCDTVVEAQLGEPIASYFEREGEDRFRDIEEGVLRDVTERHDAVIATGGGVVLREANRRLLQERTLCVYLEAAPQSLFARLRRSTRRPLLQVDDPEARIVELARQRDPLYREAARLVVPAARNGAATLAAIEEALLRHATGPDPNGTVGPCP